MEENNTIGNKSDGEVGGHSNPPPLTYNKSVFNQYVELVRSRFLKGNVIQADSILKRASQLMRDLKK